MTDYLLTGEASERLLFRKVLPEDFKAWLPFHEEPLSSQYWSGLPDDPIIACKEQFARIFERYQDRSGGMNALVSKKNKKLIGIAGLLVQHIDGKRELEIAYSILPGYWRKGYAIEAARKCKLVAFERKWAHSLVSIIQVNNVPSQKTAFKNGMYLDHRTTYKDNPVYIFRINA